jgi:hypothetical protein
MSKYDILDTVDAYIIRISNAMRYAHSDADFIGLLSVKAQLEDFSDWLMGINRAY